MRVIPYAAHCAFFAGFLPTPVSPGPHARLFALRFDGSERLADLGTQRAFLFINVSAIHQPNRHYAKVPEDCLESHGAALGYVDAALAPLWRALAARGPSFVIICSDHGTAYGEDGYWGHRLVLHVPYAHFEIPAGGKDR